MAVDVNRDGDRYTEVWDDELFPITWSIGDAVRDSELIR